MPGQLDDEMEIKLKLRTVTPRTMDSVLTLIASLSLAQMLNSLKPTLLMPDLSLILFLSSLACLTWSSVVFLGAWSSCPF